MSVLSDGFGRKPADRAAKQRRFWHGLAERLDPAALVVGPTGLALNNNGELYVADTVNNRLASIPFAWLRRTAASESWATAGRPLLTR